MCLAWNCLQINPGFLAPNITLRATALCQNGNSASNPAITGGSASSLSRPPKLPLPRQAVICGYFLQHMLMSWQNFLCIDMYVAFALMCTYTLTHSGIKMTRSFTMGMILQTIVSRYTFFLQFNLSSSYISKEFILCLVTFKGLILYKTIISIPSLSMNYPK